MKIYNWQQEDWPHFKYDLESIQAKLYEYEKRAGQANGISKSIPPDVQIEQILQMMVEEAIKTSEIEGVNLSRQDVMSSIRKNMGLPVEGNPIKDRKAKGIAEMLMNARNSFHDPISHQHLFDWHKSLMADEKNINIGSYRTHKEPMQVVSGAAGKEKVHFEAPPSARVMEEMNRFISWFNNSSPGGPIIIHAGPVRSAIAHLYFETIHPFEDGNGRIGRALAEKALSQHLGYPVLFSLSGAIESKKKNYYAALEAAERSNEITSWIHYFVQTILEAQESSSLQIEFTLQKIKFFDAHRDQLNERQLKVIQRVLNEGPGGFDGGLNARKYQAITHTSKATATRDLQDLVNKNILVSRDAGGRSTSYDLRL